MIRVGASLVCLGRRSSWSGLAMATGPGCGHGTRCCWVRLKSRCDFGVDFREWRQGVRSGSDIREWRPQGGHHEVDGVAAGHHTVMGSKNKQKNTDLSSFWLRVWLFFRILIFPAVREIFFLVFFFISSIWGLLVLVNCFWVYHLFGIFFCPWGTLLSLLTRKYLRWS